MFKLNWPEIIIVAFLGALLGFVIEMVVKCFRSLRNRYISWEKGGILHIHRVTGKVSIEEPQNGAHTGDIVHMQGGAIGFTRQSIRTLDVLLLVRSSDEDEWIPNQSSALLPDKEDKWETEIVLSNIGTTGNKYEILGMALPHDKCETIRGAKKVKIFEFPKDRDPIARLRVYHSPEASWPIKVSATKRTDWLRPNIKEFLNRSDLDLFAIDSAIITWICPIARNDGGWHDDSEIRFDFQSDLVHEDLPLEILEVSQKYRPRNPIKQDSVKYCVTELSSETRDAGGRLIIKARPIKYLTAFPVAEELSKSLELSDNHNLRDRYFSKLEARTAPKVPNMLIAHVLVVTGDNQLLLTRRRADKELDYYRAHWSATFEEHLNAPWSNYLPQQKVHPESLKVDNTIFDGIKRGLQEEMHLGDKEVSESIIRIPAVGFEYDNFNTSIYAMVELPRLLTADKMLRTRLKTSEEFDFQTSCPFDIETLLSSLLCSTQPPLRLEVNVGDNLGWKWHPTSRIRILLALRRRFGEIVLRSYLE